MQKSAYLSETINRRASVRWLWLSLSAMLISLVYALVLVLARTGYYQFMADAELGFKTALVLHVNFSLLVWFMAFAALIWNRFLSARWPVAGHIAQSLALCGVLLMAVSPLVQAGTPIMSDYVPVLDQSLFYSGLGAFVLGIAMAGLRLLCVGDFVSEPLYVRIAVQGSALVTLLAGCTFMMVWLTSEAALSGQALMDRLFWGAGHLLQINHLLLLLFCWLWLSTVYGSRPKHSALARAFVILLALIVLTALPGPLFPLMEGGGLDGKSVLFTWQMGISGSLALLLVGVILLTHNRGALSRSWRTQPMRLLLVGAVVLFITGSLVGFLIRENNALVPAHYHGMIGAVTLTFMGVAYHLLPRLGFRAPAGGLVRIQALLYSSGMLMMMLGLVLSDVPRKALTAAEAASWQLYLGRGLMGMGGGLGLLASLLFVGLMLWCLLGVQGRKAPEWVRQPLEGTDGGPF